MQLMIHYDFQVIPCGKYKFEIKVIRCQWFFIISIFQFYNIYILDCLQTMSIKKKSVTLGGIKFDDKYADILLCSKCLQF